ncbi:MAG: ABC transporter permease [Cycloclasticus pugetii]|jgi:putative ABC transport system permease protein|uniref:Peptide ABC transporter permease n=1 Tax=Cycloclasticus zancles 78-ME TaxID=1198232 RepID=S5TTR5_9GAMM|nr:MULTISPECIES: ABC transporter permease [Cycloclasticus]AFT66151.1 ABC-type antimicrobial peptide transport system, permease component [Cycloclasticus sp. P1]AGS38453.1 Peptide ABC transporter permease [Cycloclasticus zancles 78-ME]MDF1829713.1 ABC transporter permease [Cycloclasticus pugetii]
MFWSDIVGFITHVLSRHRFRTITLWLAIAIGVVAVNLLTALGEGAKSFVLKEFNVLGRNTLIVLPGKKETTGGMPPLTGESPRPLTLKDAISVSRLSGVKAVAPIVVGNIEASYDGKIREVLTIGTSRDFFLIRQLKVSQGQMLPTLDLDKGEAVCVIGNKLRQELFQNKPALGERIRLADSRFRVIGVLNQGGTSFGFDMDDVIIIPVANAQSVFNVEGLFRLFAEVRVYQQLDNIKQAIIELLKERHEGEEDVTVISQDAMLTSVQEILDILTIAVAGIASISMLVAGILIMNMMMITVSQRVKEIGLLKALGATSSTVRVLFLSEAGLIAAVASMSGLALSQLIVLLANIYFIELQFHSPWWAQVGSILLAILLALIFAWLPAQRASMLSPVEALQGKQQKEVS